MWEEGNNVALARDILVRGDWLEPAIFGLRYIEKPSLLSWLIAGTAWWRGGVDEWAARLPSALAVLGTALLVARLTQRYAGPRAALFAAGAFMFSPMLLRKLTISEPDTLVTFLSFAAFVTWWGGEARGHVATWRWLACGGLLTALAMTKGPEPVGFFALGVGGYLLARRRWVALPGFALCLGLPVMATIAWAATVYREGDPPTWFTYMRLYDPIEFTHYLHERVWFASGLPVDLIPATVVLPSLLVSWWRRSRTGAPSSPILSPLAFYAGLCVLALLWWPGTKTRYAMPAAPAVTVMAGLAVERLWRQRSRAGAAALATVVGLFAYQTVRVTVALPLFAERVSVTRRLGAEIDAAVGAAPAPIFALGVPQSNKLTYVTRPIRTLALPDQDLSPPAWVLGSMANLGEIEARRPDLVVRVVPTALTGPGFVLIRVESRQGRDEPRPE
jgi:4-amino-4-deoxy-L-arabinose transferase-like glycosyltransferase